LKFLKINIIIIICIQKGVVWKVSDKYTLLFKSGYYK
jgi:hypothetical protein